MTPSPLIALRVSAFHYPIEVHDIAQTHKLEKYEQTYAFLDICYGQLTIQPRTQAILQYRSVPDSRNLSFSCPLPGWLSAKPPLATVVKNG